MQLQFSPQFQPGVQVYKMSRLIIILVLLTIVLAQRRDLDTKKCEDFRANFNLKKIIGSWYVVAIIPEKHFPVNQEQVACYRVEFSETDVVRF